MKTIKLSLEYGAYPLWVYDENGTLVLNGVIDEIKGSALEALLNELAIEFEQQFINTPLEFAYVGSMSVSEQEKFQKKIDRAYKELESALGTKYLIVKKTN